MVRKIRFAEREQPGDGGHQFVIHPEPAHGVVDRGIDAHRHAIRIFARDALVHLEQISVALLDRMPAQPLDRSGKIEIHAQAARTHTAAFVADRLGVARGHVARHQITETRIAALQIIIALRLRESDPETAHRPLSSAPRSGRRSATIRSSTSTSIDGRQKLECTSGESA